MSPADVTPVAVDTNILFSALLRPDNHFLTVLSERGGFHVTEAVLTELFRHKEKILRLSKSSEQEVADTYERLLSWVDMYKQARIPRACWEEARALCKDIDPADTVHVALALALDGLLWTGDKVLRNGLAQRGFDRFFTPP